MLWAADWTIEPAERLHRWLRRDGANPGDLLMKLIVGLGNPGRKYANTRHNVGFEAAAQLARNFGQGAIRNRFHAEVVSSRIGGDAVLIVCPNTYMNRSGQSVREACDFYKLDPADLLVICDDMNLPLGRIRIRTQGSSGGQKGLQDIIRCLGTQQFPRLRIGIGRPPESWDAVDYVLGKFGRDERLIVDQAIMRVVQAAEDWVRNGVEYCMNRYNAPTSGEAQAE